MDDKGSYGLDILSILISCRGFSNEGKQENILGIELGLCRRTSIVDDNRQPPCPSPLESARLIERRTANAPRMSLNNNTFAIASIRMPRELKYSSL
jgi:hypothetical protein